MTYNEEESITTSEKEKENDIIIKCPIPLKIRNLGLIG